MGIHDFSKVFESIRAVKISDMAGMSVAIDAMPEIYRALHCAASQSKQTPEILNKVQDMRDECASSAESAAQSPGQSLYLHMILQLILEFHRNNVKMLWVFDNELPNPHKSKETDKRRSRRDNVRSQISSIMSSLECVVCVDDIANDTAKNVDVADSAADSTPVDAAAAIPIDAVDSATEVTPVDAAAASRVEINDKLKRITQLSKQLIAPTAETINNVKKMLMLLNIPFVTASQEFEAEAVCAFYNKYKLVDAVYSCDSDALAFGARKLYRRSTYNNQIYEYTIEHIFAQMNEKDVEGNITNFRKMAVILGTDFCAKTSMIGPKKIFKMFPIITLTQEQIDAMHIFATSGGVVAKKIDVVISEVEMQNVAMWLVGHNFEYERILRMKYQRPDQLPGTISAAASTKKVNNVNSVNNADIAKESATESTTVATDI